MKIPSYTLTIAIFIVWFPALVSAQQHLLNINEFLKTTEAGKCYVAFPQDSINQKTTYFEIVNAIYKTIEVSSKSILLEQGKDFNEDSIWRVQVIPPSVKLHRWTKRMPCRRDHRFNFDCQNMLQICLVEIPPRYVTVKKIINPQTHSIEFLPQTLQIKKMVKPSYLKIFDKETIDFVKKSNIFTLKGSNWTSWRERLSCSWNFTYDEKVAAVQRALVKHGYDIKITGVFYDKMKAALLDFQRKNGLTEGQLDIDTIRKLEVDF